MELGWQGASASGVSEAVNEESAEWAVGLLLKLMKKWADNSV